MDADTVPRKLELPVNVAIKLSEQHIAPGARVMRDKIEVTFIFAEGLRIQRQPGNVMGRSALLRISLKNVT